MIGFLESASSNLAKQFAQLLHNILENKVDEVRNTLVSLSSGRIELPAHEWDRLRSMISLAKDMPLGTSEVSALVKALEITSDEVVGDIMERPADYGEVLAENEIHRLADELIELIHDCNRIRVSKQEKEIFKPTSTMLGNLAAVGKLVKSETDFGKTD